MIRPAAQPARSPGSHREMMHSGSQDILLRGGEAGRHFVHGRLANLQDDARQNVLPATIMALALLAPSVIWAIQLD